MALRWRIAALVAVAICAVAAAVGVLVDHASRDRELSQARDSARTTLDRAAVTYARTGAVQGTGAALDAPGLPGGLRGLVAKGRQGTEFTTAEERPAMWAARPAGGQVLSVRVDMSTTMRDIRALDTSIAWASVFTTAVVLPLGVLTAGRMSRRLRTAAGTARRIAAGDLDARIRAATRPRDEIAEISAAVDTMAAALQERLRGEQRFTADVAHELRTPLMGLVTAGELLPEGRRPAMYATVYGYWPRWSRNCWRSPGWTQERNRRICPAARSEPSSRRSSPAPACPYTFLRRGRPRQVGRRKSGPTRAGWSASSPI